LDTWTNPNPMPATSPPMLADRAQLADFGPLAERALSVEPDSMIRLRAGTGTVAGYVRLPFDVLAGRTIAADLAPVGGPADVTVSAQDFLSWLEGGGEPARKDAHWLSALPPKTGWRRIELVPDAAIREVVRSGALLAQSATSRSGQQSLLDSIVLTAQSAGERVEVPLAPLSALTRMGFLPRGSEAAIDIAPGWLRVAASRGSTFLSNGKDQLGLFGL
jgi:hypothetical protein